MKRSIIRTKSFGTKQQQKTVSLIVSSSEISAFIAQIANYDVQNHPGHICEKNTFRSKREISEIVRNILKFHKIKLYCLDVKIEHDLH